MDRIIETKRPYRHFKGKLYYVHDIVEDTETREIFVSYQALYPPYKMYVRSLEMFASKIDALREDNLTHQQYRFELYGGE